MKVNESESKTKLECYLSCIREGGVHHASGMIQDDSDRPGR